MSFFVRKLLESLVLPIGMSSLLVIAGVLFRRRWLAAAAAVMLWAFSTQPVSSLLLGPLERSYPPGAIAKAPAADAIAVLSGGIVRGVNASGIQWGEASNRYFAGLGLALAGKAKILVFSAAVADDPDGPTQGAILRQAAIEQGVPPDCIVLTHRVGNTEDEARAVSQIPGVHSVLLVTSAFHMPRAVLLFRQRGLEVLSFPTDYRTFRGGRRSLSAMIPTTTALRDSQRALLEYYGMIFYRTLFLFRGAPSSEHS